MKPVQAFLSVSAIFMALLLASCEQTGEAYKAKDRRTYGGHCVDTDDGRDIFTKGRATERDGVTLRDACSTEPGLVVEAFCRRGQAATEIIECPGPCRDGACLSTCADSDGGKNLFAAGTAQLADGTTRQDACSDNLSVTEYYCKDKRRMGVLVAGCPAGCADGACLAANGTNRTRPERLCTDSDGGIVPAQKGTVRTPAGLAAQDHCLDARQLVENFCGPTGSPREELVSCPDRCHEGECRAGNQSCPPCQGDGYCVGGCGRGGCPPDPDCADMTACKDSDGGITPNVAGFAKDQQTETRDACQSNTTLLEAFCTPEAAAHLTLNNVTPIRLCGRGDSTLHLLEGRGFSPRTAVTFGNTPASKTIYVDRERLLAYGPGVTGISVAVRDRGAGSNLSLPIARCVPPPAGWAPPPEPLLAVPDAGPVSGGTAVSLYGNDFAMGTPTAARSSVDAVLVTDVSGSMDEPFPGTIPGCAAGTRLDVAKCVNKRFIDILLAADPGSRVGLVSFDGAIRQRLDLSRDAAALNSQITGYATCVSCGIKGATDMLSAQSTDPHAAKAILIMSDGRANACYAADCRAAGATPAKEMVEFACAAHNEGYDIFAVGFGLDPVAEAELKKVACCDDCAHYANGADAAQLARIFERFAAQIAALAAAPAPNGSPNVSVDGLAVPLTFISRNVLRFTMPPHAAGPAAIAVTNPDGRTTGKAAAFTYGLANASPPLVNTTPIPCNFGCANGACLPNATACQDSDGGRKSHTYGTVMTSLNGTTLGVSVDECKNSTVLIEKYCAHGRNVSEHIRCEAGCVEGACRRPNQTNSTCTDSDGGLDYGRRGTLWWNGTMLADECINRTLLRERFCDGGRLRTKNVTCPAGCHEGACRPDNASNRTCTDSDGGLDYYAPGVAREFVNGQEWSHSRDECAADHALFEKFCQPTGLIGRERFDCPGRCRDGACQGVPPANGTNSTCTDSDGGLDYGRRGTLWWNGTLFPDECVNQTGLAEQHCSRNRQNRSLFDCPGGCVNGACRGHIAGQCRDADGGAAFENASSVAIRDLYFGDYCETNVTLIESTCSAADWYEPLSHRCAACCIAGACRTETECRRPLTCSDSDGGLNYTTPGWLTYWPPDHIDDLPGRYDYCANRKELIEFFCQANGEGNTTRYRCPSGCDPKGKCRP